MDNSTIFSIAIKVAFFAIFIATGRRVILDAARNIVKGKVFDEKFLMAVASIGALALGEVAEAAAIMAFYQLGEFLSDKAEERADADITSLTKLQSDTALVLRGAAIVNQKEIEIPVESVLVGDIMVVKPGALIPCDGVVTEGKSFIDKSSVTGESTPQSVVIGSEVFSGTTNLSSLILVKATRVASQSFAQSVMTLLKDCEDKKSHAEKFITRFARLYTPIVCFAALLVAFVAPVVLVAVKVLPVSFGTFFVALKTQANFLLWIHRALMFLVVSCPCALVVSVPVALVSGVARCAKLGAIVKGTNVLESLSKVKTAVFDKTGTLTKGVFSVTAVHLNSECGSLISEEELIALAAHAERFSDHPVSKSLKSAHSCPQCSTSIPTNITEIAGMGLRVSLQVPKNTFSKAPKSSDALSATAAFQASKPPFFAKAPEGSTAFISGKSPTSQEALVANKIPTNSANQTSVSSTPSKDFAPPFESEASKKTITLLLGNKALMDANGVKIPECKMCHNGTLVYVASDGVCLGHILISDVIKKEAAHSIKLLKTFGVRHTLMLTGDEEAVAKVVAKDLGIDEYRARLLPADKVSALEALLSDRAKYKTVMYFGDGINDAPVIKRSDIGVAMGAAGKSAAVDASDIVIPCDNLTAAAFALKAAKKTLAIVKENVVFSITAKVAIMALGAFGLTGMFVAVFGDVGVSALAVLNSMRARGGKIAKKPFVADEPSIDEESSIADEGDKR